MEIYPDIFKVKLPPIYSKELEKMYEFFFDDMSNMSCGWAGRIGHYAYDENPSKNATDQDGYIYAWKHNYYTLLISASPSAYRYKYQVAPESIAEIILIT